MIKDNEINKFMNKHEIFYIILIYIFIIGIMLTLIFTPKPDTSLYSITGTVSSVQEDSSYNVIDETTGQVIHITNNTNQFKTWVGEKVFVIYNKLSDNYYKEKEVYCLSCGAELGKH